MNPLVSLELRWFLQGELPAPVRTWFNELLPGAEVSPVDKRDDIYLAQPHVEDSSVKFRQGKLEIKWRGLAAPFQGAHRTSGQLERWLKWSWEGLVAPDPEHVGAGVVARGAWLTVAKQRWQRKYCWEAGAFVPAPATEIVEVGASVEITSLELAGRAHSTVLVESFAPAPQEQSTLLDEAVKDLWREFPKDLLTREQSYGYPRWLGRFGESR